MPGRLEFDLMLSRPPAERRPRRPGEPLRLLLLGDFSGRGARGAHAAHELAERAVHRVDIDTIDTVLRRLAPLLPLTVSGESCTFAPAALDDFHPDRLLQSLPPLAGAWKRRQRLADPATFAQAAAEIGGTAGAGGGDAAADADLMSRLLGGRIEAPAAAPRAAGVVDAFVRGIVAPHVSAAAPPQQAGYVAAAEAVMASPLRELLHAPDFQSLEAAWRGVHWLASNLELDQDLQLHLFDVTREELLADIVAAQGRIEQTAMRRVLVDRGRQQPGGPGWSALVGLWSFGTSDADIGLLAAIGTLAADAGAPLLAGAGLALAADETTAQSGWPALRGSAVAPWIGLVAPRLLLRLPYGRGYEPVEGWDFEEFAAVPGPDDFLWAPGSLAAALLLGQAHAQQGWPADLDAHREIGDLPAYTLQRADGESELQACAETWLDDRSAASLLAAGLMPLASHRQRNAVVLLRWQSIAAPPAALAGLGPA